MLPLSAFRGPEDDWAANEVALQEEDDGWGGSHLNKQPAQLRSVKASDIGAETSARSKFASSQHDKGETQQILEAYGEPRQENAESEWEDEANNFLNAAEQQSRTEIADAGPAPSSVEQPEYSPEAEVLDGESDWESSEEDWEEGALPDITPLAPDEAVRPDFSDALCKKLALQSFLDPTS